MSGDVENVQAKEASTLVNVLSVSRISRSGPAEVRGEVVAAVLVMGGVSVFLVAALQAAVGYSEHGPLRLSIYSAIVLLCLLISFLVHTCPVLFTGPCLPYFVYSLSCTLGMAAVVTDLLNTGLYDDWLILFVIGELILLLCSHLACSSEGPISVDTLMHMGTALSMLSFLWVLLKTSEEVFQMGLYSRNLPYAYSFPARHSGAPLDKLLAFAHSATPRVLLVLSQWSVRSVSLSLQRKSSNELGTLKNSIKKLAAGLARYDLNLLLLAVKEAEGTSVQTEMEDTYLFLCNYRAYLPEALFLGAGARKSSGRCRVESKDGSEYIDLTVTSPTACGASGARVSFATSVGVSATPGSVSLRLSSDGWRSLDALEYARASSLPLKSVRRASSLLIEGVPEMVGSRGYIKRYSAVCCLRLERILEDVPDDLLHTVTTDFLSQSFECLRCNSGIIYSFDAFAILSTFLRASDACRAALAIRASLSTFVRKYAAFSPSFKSKSIVSDKSSSTVARWPGNVSIGIAFGPTIQSNLGNGTSLSYCLYGKAVSQALQVSHINWHYVVFRDQLAARRSSGQASANAFIASISILCTDQVEYRVRGEVSLRPFELPAHFSSQTLRILGFTYDCPLFQIDDDIAVVTAERFRVSSFCATTASSRSLGGRNSRLAGRKPTDVSARSWNSTEAATNQSRNSRMYLPVSGPFSAPSSPLSNPLTRGAPPVPEFVLPERIVLRRSVDYTKEYELFLNTLPTLQADLEEVRSFPGPTLRQFVASVMAGASEECIDFIAASVRHMSFGAAPVSESTSQHEDSAQDPGEG